MFIKCILHIKLLNIYAIKLKYTKQTPFYYGHFQCKYVKNVSSPKMERFTSKNNFFNIIKNLNVFVAFF